MLVVGVAAGQYVEDSIYVGFPVVLGFAYNPTADAVYGWRTTEPDGLFAINCTSNEVTTVTGVDWPEGAAYDSIDDKLYCTSFLDSVFVVDGMTHTRVGAADLAGYDTPVWDPATNRLYVCSGDGVAVVDCTTDSVIARIPTSLSPHLMHLNSRHRKLYVSNYSSETLYVVDIDANVVAAVLPAPYGLLCACYSQSADRLYLGGRSELSVIDGLGDSVLAKMEFRHVFDVAVNERDRRLFVASLETLYVVDVDTDSVLHGHEGPNTGNAGILLWSRETNLVYCVWTGIYVYVLSGDGSRIVERLRVTAGPRVLGQSPVSRRIYVGHDHTSWVFVIKDTLTGIAEEKPSAQRDWSSPTIRFGSLMLPARQEAVLLDLTGRKVMDLEPGENDVRHVAPGVYFVRPAVTVPVGQGTVPVRAKVVIAR